MSFYTKNKEGIVLVPIEKVETLLNNGVKFYSDKDLIYELGLKIEKLQEQNKILIEALEFVIKESGSSTNYNKMAREALAKVGE